MRLNAVHTDYCSAINYDGVISGGGVDIAVQAALYADTKELANVSIHVLTALSKDSTSAIPQLSRYLCGTGRICMQLVLERSLFQALHKYAELQFGTEVRLLLRVMERIQEHIHFPFVCFPEDKALLERLLFDEQETPLLNAIKALYRAATEKTPEEINRMIRNAKKRWTVTKFGTTSL